MSHVCTEPLPLDALVDYVAGELEPADAARIEEHFFGCGHCTARLEAVERLGQAIASAVRSGQAAMPVTADVVERVAADGLTLRQYAIEPGQSVACTVAPHDDLVVVRLHAPFDGEAETTVKVQARDLQTDTESRFDLPAVVDRQREEIVLLFRGDEVRGYPRSLWTMHVVVESSGASTHRLGPYVMDHTPWDQLETPP